MSLPLNSSSGVPTSTADELTRYYADAAARMAAIVLNPGSSAAAVSRARKMLQQIDEIARRMKIEASGWVGTNVPAAMAMGIREGERQALAVGVDVDPVSLKGSFGLIDQDVLHVLARDTAGDLYKAADNLGERAKTVLRHTSQLGLGEGQINKILAGGMIDGQPAHTIQNLRKALQAVHGLEVPIEGKDGVTRNYDVADYARVVVRTKTREAAVKSQNGRLVDLGLDLVSIVGRISKTFCTAYLGQVFSISGKSDKYPALSSLPNGGPPFHPNCSKSTRAWIEAYATVTERELAPGVQDAHQLQNVTSAEAQRRYQDLQIHQQVLTGYAKKMGAK